VRVEETEAYAKTGSQYWSVQSITPESSCAYYGGRTNAVSLYKQVTGDEKIFYINVCSMYPTVMSLPQYIYPINQHEARQFDNPNMPLVPLEELFGFQKCRVTPAGYRYSDIRARVGT